MSRDVSILFAPRALDLATIVEAAREALAKEHPEDLDLHVADESAATAGLRKHVKKLTAISLWSDDPGFAWDELGRVLSRKVPGRLLALLSAEAGGMAGFQIVEKGQLGDACPADEGDELSNVRQAFDEAYVVALSEEEAEDLVATLAAGASRGVCLHAKRPDLGAGQLLGLADLERSRSVLQCCLLDLPDEPGG